MIILILFLLALAVLIYFFVRSWFNKKELSKQFSQCNCIVFGKKGTGKDLIFQSVINDRKKPYFSNVNYGGDFLEATPKSLELPNNTYHNFINGNVHTEEKPPYENKDFYFSDCGIILPSQYDTQLYKMYPSFGITYALSRHLYNNNVHCNTQALGRVWKCLREQADYYIRCKQTINIFGFLVTRYTTYTNYESALSCLSPLTSRMLNNFSKAEVDKYIAMNGEIKNGFIIQHKKKIRYDTRAYHEKIFGVKAPRKENSCNKKTI